MAKKKKINIYVYNMCVNAIDCERRVTIVVVGSAAAVLGVKSVSPCGSFEFYNHRPADKFVIS